MCIKLTWKEKHIDARIWNLKYWWKCDKDVIYAIKWKLWDIKFWLVNKIKR